MKTCEERKIRSCGKILVYFPDHPRANRYGFVLEHILVAERALGKPLPLGAVIHHVDEKTDNNQNNNLVICQNDAYHKILHLRKNSLLACGHLNWRKCPFCKKHDDSKNMKKNGRAYYHNSCKYKYNIERKHKNGANVGF
jgi:hypothetical protein